MRAAGEVLAKFQHVVEDITLRPGPNGIFDVEVNGDLIYSKYETQRHAEPGEIADLVRGIVGPDVREYGT